MSNKREWQLPLYAVLLNNDLEEQEGPRTR